MQSNDVVELVRLLKLLRQEHEAGQPMASPVFEASLKVFVQVAVETVFLRRRSPGFDFGLIEALLVRRPADDPAHPSDWHSPGSFNRHGEPTEATIARIMQRELGGSATLVSATQVTAMNLGVGHRGHCWQIVYSCRITGVPERGTWFPITALPEPIVQGHPNLIWLAAKPYLESPFIIG